MYDFARHSRSETETRWVGPADVVVVEGILVLAMEEVRSLCNMKVFVDTGERLRPGGPLRPHRLLGTGCRGRVRVKREETV